MRKAPLFALILSLAGARALAADEEPASLPVSRSLVRLQGGEPSEGRMSLALLARFSVLGGKLDDGLKYGHLFDAGIGLGVEADFMIAETGGWSFGPYVSIGWDTFGGGEETDNGVTVEADDAELLTALFGFKGQYQVTRAFSFDFRLGLGLAQFGSVDAEVGPAGTKQELLESTATVAGEAGLRGSFGASRVRLEFGLGVRIIGAPDEGDIDVNSDPILQYLIDFGVRLGF